MRHWSVRLVSPLSSRGLGLLRFHFTCSPLNSTHTTQSQAGLQAISPETQSRTWALRQPGVLQNQDKVRGKPGCCFRQLLDFSFPLWSRIVHAEPVARAVNLLHLPPPTRDVCWGAASLQITCSEVLASPINRTCCDYPAFIIITHGPGTCRLENSSDSLEEAVWGARSSPPL